MPQTASHHLFLTTLFSIWNYSVHSFILLVSPLTPTHNVNFKKAFFIVLFLTSKSVPATVVVVVFSCYVVFDSFVISWTVAHQAPLSMGFPRQEHWSGLPSLLHGIFLIQGLNSFVFLALQVDSLLLSHQTSLVIR